MSCRSCTACLSNLPEISRFYPILELINIFFFTQIVNRSPIFSPIVHSYLRFWLVLFLNFTRNVYYGLGGKNPVTYQRCRSYTTYPYMNHEDPNFLSVWNYIAMKKTRTKITEIGTLPNNISTGIRRVSTITSMKSGTFDAHNEY